MLRGEVRHQKMPTTLLICNARTSSIFYCCITNYPKWWLTITIQVLSCSLPTLLQSDCDTQAPSLQGGPVGAWTRTSEDPGQAGAASESKHQLVLCSQQPERGGREDQGEDEQKWSGEVKVEDGCLTPPGFCHKGTEQRNEA